MNHGNGNLQKERKIPFPFLASGLTLDISVQIDNDSLNKKDAKTTEILWAKEKNMLWKI